MGGILLTISILSSCNDSELFEEDNLLPDGETEEAADAVKFASIAEFESLSADKIPGNNSGYEITSLSYECVDTIELRALLLDVTATLESKSSGTRTVKFSAEVGPELVSVEYVPGGEMRPAHDNMYTGFWPKVERYRNYSDGSRIGPDVFYDYGHPQFIDPRYAGLTPPELILFMTFEQELIPSAFDIPGSFIVNPEYSYYEDGWFCFHFRDRENVNINAVIKKSDGTSYHGDDLLITTRIPDFEDIDRLITERFAQFEKDKYDFYVKYIEEAIYSKEDEEVLNMCRNVPDVSAKPFPKEERELSAGWYSGCFRFDNPDQFNFASRYMTSYNRPYDDTYGLTFFSSNEVCLQYLVIDGRIIHFVDLCDYKTLGADMTLKRTEYGYLFQSEHRINLYGYNMKLIYDCEIVAIDGEHVEYDWRDYNEIDRIDNENSDASRSNNPAGSRSGAPITIYDSGKMIEIDASLPESVRNVSKSRTLNY